MQRNSAADGPPLDRYLAVSTALRLTRMLAAERGVLCRWLGWGFPVPVAQHTQSVVSSAMVLKDRSSPTFTPSPGHAGVGRAPASAPALQKVVRQQEAMLRDQDAMLAATATALQERTEDVAALEAEIERLQHEVAKAQEWQTAVGTPQMQGAGVQYCALLPAKEEAPGVVPGLLWPMEAALARRRLIKQTRKTPPPVVTP